MLDFDRPVRHPATEVAAWLLLPSKARVRDCLNRRLPSPMDLNQRLVLDPDGTAEHQQLEGCHDEGWRPLSERQGARRSRAPRRGERDAADDNVLL